MSLSIPFTARLYISGYKGILTGDSILLSNADIPALIESFHKMGGSPIGSSRVKLTNIEDCISRGYVPKGKVPLEVAAEQVGKQAPSPSQLQHQAQRFTDTTLLRFAFLRSSRRTVSTCSTPLGEMIPTRRPGSCPFTLPRKVTSCRLLECQR